VVLVDADRVVAALLVELHLPEVLVVDLAAERRVVEPVGVGVVGRLREMRPGHQIERVDLHAHLPAIDGVRQAGMISRLQASSVPAMFDPMSRASTCVTPQPSSRRTVCATSAAVPAKTKRRAISSGIGRAWAAPALMCSSQRKRARIVAPSERIASPPAAI